MKIAESSAVVLKFSTLSILLNFLKASFLPQINDYMENKFSKYLIGFTKNQNSLLTL